jgi:hypothetical protein
VHELVRRRRLIAVPGPRGPLYPAFQFGPDGRPYPLISDLIKIFEPAAAQPHTFAAWFVTPQRSLEDKTPTQWLKDGRDAVTLREAARRSAARLAH